MVASILPFYEAAPGHTLDTKDDGLPLPNFQWYNGGMWLLPAFRRWANVEADTSIKARLLAVIGRLSQWSVDLDAAAPQLGFNIAAFHRNRQILASDPRKPLPTIAGQLTPRATPRRH